MRRSFLGRVVVLGAIVLPLAVATAATADPLPDLSANTADSAINKYNTAGIPWDLSAGENRGSELAPGKSLRKNQYLLSLNEQYAFALQGDIPQGNSCNAVLYKKVQVGNEFFAEALWASKTDGQPCDRLEMQEEDGNLVLVTSNNQPLWNAGTDGNPRARLEVQDGGNVVAYRKGAVDDRGAIAATDTDGGRRSLHFGSFEKAGMSSAGPSIFFEKVGQYFAGFASVAEGKP